MANTLFYGDNLQVLREHIPDESVDAKLSAVNAVAKFADKQPQDGAANQFLMIGDPAVLVGAGAIGLAEQDLSANAREALVKAGCDLQY